MSKGLNFPKPPIIFRNTQRSVAEYLRAQERCEREYFEALVGACKGTCNPVVDDGLPGGHTDYEVHFDGDNLISELKSVGDSKVVQTRDSIRDAIVLELEKRGEMLWIFTDAPWRNWIESRQLPSHTKIAKQIVDAATTAASHLVDSGTGEDAKVASEFTFGTVGLTVMRANTVSVYVSEFERIDLAERIRDTLGQARSQHKTSRSPELPLVVVLFLRDAFDDIKAVATAICGDLEVHLKIPSPGSNVPVKATPGRTNRFFAPHKNTSVSGVLYVPCGSNWSQSPVTLIPNPFARCPVKESWFKHSDIARQEIDLSS